MGWGGTLHCQHCGEPAHQCDGVCLWFVVKGQTIEPRHREMDYCDFDRGPLCLHREQCWERCRYRPAPK